MTQPYKQIRRSRTNRMLTGVCGGIAQYFNVDPVLVRLGFVVATFLTGGIVLVAYIVAAVIVPEEP